MVSINEIRIDQPGTDNDEYFELFGEANAGLDGLFYLVIGDGTGGSGVIENVVDLSGLTLNADGFLVAAESTFSLGTADLTLDLNFENSDNVTHLLVRDFTGAGGDDLDTDDDGTFDIVPWSDIIDAVALIETLGSGDRVYSSTQVGPDGSFVPGHVFRDVDGGGDFQIGAFDPVGGDDTPGTTNIGGSVPPTLVAINQIQGSGDESPLVGSTVTTTGIVTKLLSNGFFLQTPDAEVDADPLTSEGVFVFTGSAPPVTVGNAAVVTGTVSEFFGATQVSATTVSVADPATISPLPSAVQISLPGLEQADLEAYEGMRFELVSSGAEPLVVIENFNLDRFGEITVAEGNQTQPTQIFDPATQQAEIQALLAQNVNERLLLDDGNNAQNPTEFPYLPANVGDDGDGILDAEDAFSAAGPTVRLGAELTTSVAGVLSFGFGEYRLLVDETIGLDPATNEAARPNDAPAVGGELQVASFNVLNYFTTLDDGSLTGPNGNLEPRGANTASELQRQTDKLVAALAELDAEVIGLQELENNGTIALSTLVDELNTFLGAPIYDYVDPTGTGDFIGTDAITTGLIYKPEAVAVVATDFLGFAESSAANTFALAEVLNPFVSAGDRVGNFQRNRPAVAATFQTPDGEAFTVAVNHFKSKGDSNLQDLVEAAQAALDGGATGFTQADIDALVNDPNYDQGDGQGFWNQVRADAAQELIQWLTDTSASGYAGGAIADPDFLVVGDLNAYAQEDPVDAVEAGAHGETFTDLIDSFVPGGQAAAYSFVFDGQRGSLDHALSTQSLLSQVTGVAEWHINADEPDLLNYDETFNDSRFYDDNLFGASDHDPLLIGLDLNSINLIEGTADRDTLIGTDEDDRIIGFEGRDRITTGGGNDIIAYTSILDRGDIITDFDQGSDLIDMSGALMSLGYDGDDAFGDGYLGFRGGNGVTLLTLDPDGAAGPAKARNFLLVQRVALSASDVIV